LSVLEAEAVKEPLMLEIMVAPVVEVVKVQLLVELESLDKVSMEVLVLPMEFPGPLVAVVVEQVQ
jgi:hypothetical protein